MKKAAIVIALLACTVLPAAEETRPAKPLPEQPHPPYPTAAWNERKEGSVVFKARIGVDGAVEAVDILETPGEEMGFEETVRKTVSTWRFEPALHDGEPVPWFHTGTIEFIRWLPRTQARMYAERPEVVWGVILSILKDRKIKAELTNVSAGVINTRPKQIGKPHLPVKMPRLPDAGKVMMASFRIYVPRFVHPARVYVDSVVTTKTRAYYETRAPESWLLDRIDERLGKSGHAIPMSGARRAKQAAALAGDDGSGECRDVGPPQRLRDPERNVVIVAEPQRMMDTYYEPIYPVPDRRKRRSGKIIFGAVIWEDGTVHDVETLLDRTDSPSIPVAARQAVRMWRYWPARRKDDGCPVAVFFQINIDFNLK